MNNVANNRLAPLHRHLMVPERETIQAERMADGVLHLLGIVTGLISATVLITLAVVWYGDAPTVVAAVVYGVSFVAMLTCSAIYHMSRQGPAKVFLRRLDHAAIYVKIAGTYTPFAVLLAGDDAAPILVGIWGAALVGMIFELTAPERIERISLAIYVAMGWGVVVICDPILNALSAETFRMMVAGGAIYTLGIVFFLAKRVRFHMAIWHGFVLGASLTIYTALVLEISLHAPVHAAI